jgi:hypothetical protein
MHPPRILRKRSLWSLLAALLACNWVAAVAIAVEPSVQTAKPPGAGAGAGTGTTFDVDVRGSVYYLASDDLEGRGVGTTGLNKAADFIADNFRKLKLQPVAGRDGYFQQFKMTTAVKPGEATWLRITSAGADGNPQDPKPYLRGEDYIPLSFSAEKDFDAPLAFVGYAVNEPHYGYNDFDGIDVKGKVALALRYEPHDGLGHSRFSEDKDEYSPAATLGRKAKAAADAGAVALVIVNPPTFHEEEDPLVPFSRMFGGEHAGIPVVQVRRKVVDEWLKQAGSKEDLKALQEAIDDVGKPHSVVLPTTLRVKGNVSVDRVQQDVKNVMAELRGTGPQADEYVIVGAHYDHLGRGGFGSLNPRSHDIHNGADDNASGTAAVLELAEHYAWRGSPGRSILFVAFTGEEEGLIGSQYLVSHPPVPLDKVAFMINLDMVGRIQNETVFVGGGGTAPSFEKILAGADKASPLQIKSYGKGGMGPSDHMTFATKRIPVLFFHSGMHADYHRPTDDADKINFVGIKEVVELAAGVIDKLLLLPREQYVEAADAHSMFGWPGRGPGQGGGSSFKASLGVIPDYSAEDVKGVRINGTSPGSPADKAGLKDGDVLVKWDGRKMDSVYDLTEELTKAKPGQTVKISVQRGENTIEVQATLAEPRR